MITSLVTLIVFAVLFVMVYKFSSFVYNIMTALFLGIIIYAWAIVTGKPTEAAARLDQAISKRFPSKS